MIKANRLVRLLNKLQKNDGYDALFTCRKCNEAGINFQLTIMARGFFVACFKAWDLLFSFFGWQSSHLNVWCYQAMGGRCGLTRAVFPLRRDLPWRLVAEGQQPCRDVACGAVWTWRWV